MRDGYSQLVQVKIDIQRLTYDGFKYQIKNGGFLVFVGGTGTSYYFIAEEPSPWILMTLLF